MLAYSKEDKLLAIGFRLPIEGENVYLRFLDCGVFLFSLGEEICTYALK